MSILPEHQVQVIFESHDTRVPSKINLTLMGYWTSEREEEEGKESNLLVVYDLKKAIVKKTGIPRALLHLGDGLNEDWRPLNSAIIEDSKLKDYYDKSIIDSSNKLPTFIIAIENNWVKFQIEIDELTEGMNWLLSEMKFDKSVGEWKAS